MLPVHTKLQHLWRDRGLGELARTELLCCLWAGISTCSWQGCAGNTNEKRFVSDTLISGAVGFRFKNLQVEQELNGGSCLPQELTGASGKLQQCQFVR